MPVAMTREGSTYYLSYDQVGSLRVVADPYGNMIKKVEYDSFGNIIDDTNLTFEVPFGFAGGLYDRDTGLVRFGLRDYDPDTGRWTAKDPILFAGGATDLYGYCLNDPINLIDPKGLWGVKIGGTLIGADFSAIIYDSNTGWFTVTKPILQVSTTIFGGGMQITFDNDPCESLTSRTEDIMISLGLPVSFSSSVENFATSLGYSFNTLFK